MMRQTRNFWRSMENKTLRNCTICGEESIINGCIVCGQLAHPGWELCESCTEKEVEAMKTAKEIVFSGKPNPYFENGKWYWYDETCFPSRPYDTESEAKKDLNRYVCWLNGEMDESSDAVTGCGDK